MRFLTLVASSLFLDVLMYIFPRAVFCPSIFRSRVSRLLRTFDPKQQASFHNSCWHSFPPQKRMIDLVPIARRPSASSACACQRLWLSLPLPPSPHPSTLAPPLPSKSQVCNRSESLCIFPLWRLKKKTDRSAAVFTYAHIAVFMSYHYPP